MCVCVCECVYIYIYIYISFYRYLIAWMLFCDDSFPAVLLRQSSGREKKILEESKKIEKFCQKNVRLVFNSLCVCVWIIFAY